MDSSSGMGRIGRIVHQGIEKLTNSGSDAIDALKTLKKKDITDATLKKSGNSATAKTLNLVANAGVLHKALAPLGAEEEPALKSAFATKFDSKNIQTSSDLKSAIAEARTEVGQITKPLLEALKNKLMDGADRYSANMDRNQLAMDLVGLINLEESISKKSGTLETALKEAQNEIESIKDHIEMLTEYAADPEESDKHKLEWKEKIVLREENLKIAENDVKTLQAELKASIQESKNECINLLEKINEKIPLVQAHLQKPDSGKEGLDFNSIRKTI